MPTKRRRKKYKKKFKKGTKKKTLSYRRRSRKRGGMYSNLAKKAIENAQQQKANEEAYRAADNAGQKFFDGQPYQEDPEIYRMKTALAARGFKQASKYKQRERKEKEKERGKKVRDEKVKKVRDDLVKKVQVLKKNKMGGRRKRRTRKYRKRGGATPPKNIDPMKGPAGSPKHVLRSETGLKARVLREEKEQRAWDKRTADYRRERYQADGPLDYYRRRHHGYMEAYNPSGQSIPGQVELSESPYLADSLPRASPQTIDDNSRQAAIDDIEFGTADEANNKLARELASHYANIATAHTGIERSSSHRREQYPRTSSSRFKRLSKTIKRGFKKRLKGLRSRFTRKRKKS